MPIWQTTPPETPERYRFRIIRTPASGTIAGIVSTVDLLGCYTHYVQSRTSPCEGSADCENCHAGHSRRWHGYLGVLLMPSLEHAIFEVTATASDIFKRYFDHHRTLRYCGFRACRPSKRPNGRVVIAVSHADEQKYQLPSPPDLQAILCHIWNVQNVAKPTQRGNHMSVNNMDRTRPIAEDLTRAMTPPGGNGRGLSPLES